MKRKLKRDTELNVDSKYSYAMKLMKRYAFLAFAVIFLTFFVIYWTWLLLSSDYFNWELNPVYNHISSSEEDNDDELSRYKYHEVEIDPYAKDAQEVPTSTENVETVTI